MMVAFLLVWLALCAWYDLRKREVPDWLTLPVVALGLVWRLFQGGEWLSWVLAGVTFGLCLLGVIPGGDMKGLVALAFWDERFYLAAWLGALGVYLFWLAVWRERRMPGYVGFVVGGLVMALFAG